MPMIRKQIYLSSDADRALTLEAKRRHVSQAAVIREKLTSAGRMPSQRVPDERARTEAITALRKLRNAITPGAGAGRKFNREDAYGERLERVDPRRHKRTRLRG